MTDRREEWTDEPEKFLPGSFGCHEALHTASVLMDMVARHLLQHPTIRMSGEYTELADKAHTALFDLYQAIGRDHLK